jgi:hypothetical protein
MLLGLPALAGIALLTVSCAKEPTDAVTAARTAMDAARAAQASDYAPASFSAAETAVANLEAELKVQSDKFALTRSYAKAAELATAAKAAADKAAADAVTGKEAMKAEATTLIAAVKAQVDATKKLLDKAPKGKGSAADIAAMKSDVTGVETSLGEMDAAMTGGRYKDAKAKADAAKASLDKIAADVQAAMEAKKAAHR